jgi:protein tyrosine phosphatase (PTP) superfamily phosphohydrolase (DUF442 family)
LPAAPADTPPTVLDPLPEKTPQATPEPAGAYKNKPVTGKINFEAARTGRRPSLIEGDNIAQTTVTTPEPTKGSARGSASSSTEFVLENLPPLDVPKDESRNELPEPAETKVVNSQPATAEKSVAVAPAPAPAEVSAAPGIRHFVSPEPKLAGGSLPDAAGLDWLAEKGYKTFLDLREASEVQPAFMARVAERGMRYVSMPIGLKSFTAENVARFNFELSVADARPLYFCDSDGARAGALWFVRRLTVDRVDSQTATREAEELGLTDKAFWDAATRYVETLKPAVEKRASEAPPTPPPAADTTAPKAPQAAAPATAPTAQAASVEKPLDIAQTPEPSPADVAPYDATAWRPYAALVVTGLGIPLAYLGRSALPSIRMLSRASLPSPGRRSKSLPAASGE